MSTPVRDRSEALGRLADLAPRLESFGVTSLRVVGSAGRDAMLDDEQTSFKTALLRSLNDVVPAYPEVGHGDRP